MENSAGVAFYEYSPLEDETSIRVVTILPGEFGDPLRVDIEHKSLVTPEVPKSTRLSVKEIRRTVPEGWDAYETLEGRILFENWEIRSTTWLHPDPDVDHALYDPIPDGEANLSVPIYEALSYAWGPPRKDKVVEVVAPKTKSERASSDNFSQETRKLRITRNLAIALRHLRLQDRPRTMWVDAICINQSNDQERSEQVQRMGQIFSLASRVVAWLGPSFPDSSVALAALRRVGEQVEYSTDRRFLPPPQCSHPDWHRQDTQLPLTTNEITALTRLYGVEYLSRLWVVQELQLGNAKSVVVCGNDEIPWPCFRQATLCIRNQQATCASLREVSHWEISYTNSTTANVLMAGIKYYSKSILEVLKQVFLAFLDREKRLGQLVYARSDVNSTSAWPTWLPNWAQFVRITMNNWGGFQASGMSAARAKYIDPNKLEVAGLAFATVSTVGQPLMLPDDSPDLAEIVRGAGQENLQLSTYVNGESRLDAYVQTLSAGWVRERTNVNIDPTIRELRDEMARLATKLEIGDPLPKSIALTHEIEAMKEPRVFTLANGYIGLFDGHPHLGDEVFVILGCALPVILRRTSTGEYEVVGNCYVHGIMDGEALLGAPPRPWEVLVSPNEIGSWMPTFQNTDTGVEAEDDPRLPNIGIPVEWEPVGFERTAEDPVYCFSRKR
ncbi:hypothetical protein ONZ43_g3688 [Nemania bipapillata]|uniref:Uncharacterized protein n=1 Tax=Nemania bipapillata TaxID=110536 RepID=A0ACC2IVU4_9PEZI|nr:hypothetical protein ONZ43_g3688 [Nemania bipapillata]